MALLEILKYPDPRLRKMSEPVSEVSPELKKFSEDMLETMYSFKGIGLAAPQVNNRIRLMVIDTRPSDKSDRYENEDLTDLEKKVTQPLCFFNPVIVEKEGLTTFDEGCLSVPSYYETVERYETIVVEALDQNGEKFTIKTDGLLSICIQHEIDHLDGKLFIDRLSTVKSNKLKRQIKKYGYPEKKDDKSDAQSE